MAGICLWEVYINSENQGHVARHTISHEIPNRSDIICTTGGRIESTHGILGAICISDIDNLTKRKIFS